MLYAIAMRQITIYLDWLLYKTREHQATTACDVTVCRYSDEEISRKVSIYREMLMDNLHDSTSASGGASGGASGATVDRDDAGRPMYVLSLHDIVKDACQCELFM